MLPPPPGGMKIAPPPAMLGVSREATPTSSPTHVAKPNQATSAAQPPQPSNPDWVQF